MTLPINTFWRLHLSKRVVVKFPTNGTCRQVGADPGVAFVSLLVEPLHMRIESETVIGVQELASGFICRVFNFIFPCDHFVHHRD